MSRIPLALALLIALPAAAAEQSVALKPGVGLEQVNQNCAGCHSLDYIRMNAPFLSADGWKAEIGKMRAAYGAPVADADAALIQKYLTENYGPP